MGKTVLSVENLQTYYQSRSKEQVHAVDGVSFELEEGKVLGIAGESGCGKSTLALSVMGYYFPPLHYSGGSIVIGGTDIMKLPYEELRVRYLGSEIAYIPQAAMNALNPTRKIIKYAADLMHVHRPELNQEQITRLAEEKFDFLKLPRRVLNAYPTELSGGMKQRTVIALATLMNPKILIADEPSSALDVSSQKTVIDMLRRMMRNGQVKSMIFITHELPLLRHVADDILVMYAGQFVEKGTSEQIIFDPVHPYSHALMGSIIVPEEGVKGQKLSAIPGSPPSLKAKMTGCRFAPRCVYATPACSGADVAQREIGGGRACRCVFSEEKLRGLYAAERGARKEG